MSLMSDAFIFSSGNELSNLPYPDDINFGPVPEKTSSQTSFLSPSSPSIRAGQICPPSFTAATAIETYSEKANEQLHQFKGALNLSCSAWAGTTSTPASQLSRLDRAITTQAAAVLVHVLQNVPTLTTTSGSGAALVHNELTR